ncbi:hypothetical protein SAMN05421505_10242 [Sinosporangium album]|uniref:FXSXX-COOH protein n=2 Tax=Sinosporangium album TaxID=504805 RepID=A0A1G7RTW3_9ACTN|nr:hypothetical protein SAMN05421505_10242 [Sinosporangium album]
MVAASDVRLVRETAAQLDVATVDRVVRALCEAATPTVSAQSYTHTVSAWGA